MFFVLKPLPFSLAQRGGILLLLLLCLTSMAWAETVSNPSSDSAIDLNASSIENKIKLVNEKQGLDAASKTKIVAIYQTIKENLDNSKHYREKSSYYQDALQSAPLKIKALQAEVTRQEKLLTDKNSENFQTIPTDELEQRYIIEKSKISDLEDNIEKNQSEILVQNSRPELLHTESAAAKQALESAQQHLQNFSSNTDAKLENEAQQLLLKAQIDARAAEIKMYELEAISNSIRIQLIKVNLQVLTLKRTALEPVINAIEEELALRRQQEADKVSEELSQAEKEVAGKPKIIQRVTRENIQFSRELQLVTQKLERLSGQKSLIDQDALTITENQKSAEKKINLASLNPALGKALREQRSNLNFSDDFLLQSQTLENDTALASLNQFKVDDNLKLLSDIDHELNRLLEQEVDKSMLANERLHIKAELRILLNNQKDILSKLSNLYINYVHALNDLSFARQQLITQAANYADYLDKRLLWVPSSAPLDTSFMLQVYQAVKGLLSPRQWLQFLQDCAHTFNRHAFLAFVALLNVVVLQLCQAKLTTLIAENNSKVLKPATDRFIYTALNLLFTLGLAAPMALLLYYFGWFLSHDLQLSGFTKAVGVATRTIAMPVYFTEFFYRLFALDGIARKHFHWRKNPIALIRRQLEIIKYFVIPAVFLVVLTNNTTQLTNSDSLGRLALICSLLTLCYIVATLSHPKHEVLPKYIYDNSHNWLNKLRWLWYPLLCGIPFIIIGFAVSGYYQSALELNDKFIDSLILIIVAVMVHESVIRWLILVNRQLALENARLHETQTDEAADKMFDISTINAQTIQILNVTILLGIFISSWMVWRDILPAFSILDQVVLWQQTKTIGSQEVTTPITLTNLIFALIYLLIALVTVKNFAGVIELLIFRRISIEAGSRYAIIQLSKYAIMTLALVTCAAELGGSWAQVQWLVAALGVGLGFGLQEIFANMVSGIILLFERPIRVGDTVTVGDITGTVNRIQIRATTVIDRDQKELIVPNKTFITNQLINWTLTDPVTRLVIPIGIAYGSDIELAHRVMLETIQDIPQILQQPEPSVLLVSFGESSLNFSIRIFVGQLVERSLVTHELHLKLEKAFRQHHIVLPFPQQDVHLHQVTAATPSASSATDAH